MKKGDVGMAKRFSNKTLGRALDPRANGTWLSKLTEWNQEVVILGGQTIDQKLRVWQVGALASKFGFYKRIVCNIKKNVMVWNRNAKIYAIGETECNEICLRRTKNWSEKK